MLIVDYDAHHGNGTQDIFYADARVLYVSLHEWPLYPGTGRLDEIGHGRGDGHDRQRPAARPARPATSTSRALDEVVAPAGRAVRARPGCWSRPASTPTAPTRSPGSGSSAGDYADLTARAGRSWCRARPARSSFLEGGYDLDALRDSVAASLAGPGRRRPRRPRAGHRRAGPGQRSSRPSRDLWHAGRRWPSRIRPIGRSRTRASPCRCRSGDTAGGVAVLDLDQLLRDAVEREASDVHIKVGSPPYVRVDGHLERTELDEVTPADTERIAFAIMPKHRAEEFLDHQRGRLRLHASPGLGRFRVNVLPPARLGRPRAAARAAASIPSFEELGLPAGRAPPRRGRSAASCSSPARPARARRRRSPR